MGSFSLAEVSAKTDVLVVSSSRCERAGRYPLAALIERYGRIFTVPDLLGELSRNRPKRGSDLCGVHCPELPALFEAKAIINPPSSLVDYPVIQSRHELKPRGLAFDERQ
jgi:hypothetical protein